MHDGDPQIERDLERLAAVKRRRQERAACVLLGATPQAGTRSARCMRTDQAVEAALLKLVGKRPFQSMLDLGTGTGRLLEMFAPLYRRGVGIDMSREMLAVARANLDKAGVAQCAGPAGRHLRAAGRARQLRPGHHPPGAALSRRPGDWRSARRRGCCGRPGGW